MCRTGQVRFYSTARRNIYRRSGSLSRLPISGFPPPREIVRLPTHVEIVDVHRVFLTFDRLALDPDFLAGVQRDFVLVFNFVKVALIVDQDNVSTFLATTLVAAGTAGVLRNAFRIAQYAAHFGFFAHIVGIQERCRKENCQ
jgi:hypothetical protein